MAECDQQGYVPESMWARMDIQSEFKTKCGNFSEFSVEIAIDSPKLTEYEWVERRWVSVGLHLELKYHTSPYDCPHDVLLFIIIASYS